MDLYSASLGLAAGVVIAAPLAWLWSRRTERRVLQLEERTRRAERLAELGTMTSGLAHEIKNPLSTIGLNAQLIQEDLGEVLTSLHDAEAATDQLGRVQRRFGSLQREIMRLREILEDFLRFAGRVELDRQPQAINRIADELVDFFQPQAEEAGVRLRTQLTADPDRIAIDETLLKQAILNLMINATQAMEAAQLKDEPHGGANELIIRTVNRRERSDAYLDLHITDTGPGLPDEIKDKVFQPYFSTKKRGSGLGLPIARRIVEEHGGTLAVHADSGRGTDFVIQLPLR